MRESVPAGEWRSAAEIVRPPNVVLKVASVSVRCVYCLLSMVVVAWVSIAFPRGNSGAAAAFTRLPDPFLIEITGSSKQWFVRYPGLLRQGAAAARPLTEIPVPAGRPVELLLKSDDYVYTFEVAGRGKEIAVPSLEFSLPLTPQPPGSVDFVGEPMCGEPHSNMEGHLRFEPPDEFLDSCEAAWSAPLTAVDPTDASRRSLVR